MHFCGGLLAAASLLAPTIAGAQETPQFDAPERIMAGDKAAGEGRLYPSPALHDFDGDGNLDMIVGDLRGALTITSRDADGNWSEEKPLMSAEGKPIKLSNW